MLDIEGVLSVDEVVVVGDEGAVERQLGRFEDAGVTEFVAVPFGAPEQVGRTLRLMGHLERARRTTTA